jgi:hypothetical protein
LCFAFSLASNEKSRATAYTLVYTLFTDDLCISAGGGNTPVTLPADLSEYVRSENDRFEQRVADQGSHSKPPSVVVSEFVDDAASDERMTAEFTTVPPPYELHMAWTGKVFDFVAGYKFDATPTTQIDYEIANCLRPILTSMQAVRERHLNSSPNDVSLRRQY